MRKLTIIDACTAGMLSAMDSTFNGEIPAQFDRDTSFRSAWIEAYNGMAVTVDQRCYSPGMFEKPEPKPQRKPRQKAATTAQANPSMMAVLERRLAEHV